MSLFLIDTEAPLNVLFETADYRIRTVTQVLENIAFRSEIGSDTVVLSDFCKMLTIALRDGCDVMDVIGRRLRALRRSEENGRSKVARLAWGGRLLDRYIRVSLHHSFPFLGVPYPDHFDRMLLCIFNEVLFARFDRQVQKYVVGMRMLPGRYLI